MRKLFLMLTLLIALTSKAYALNTEYKNERDLLLNILFYTSGLNSNPTSKTYYFCVHSKDYEIKQELWANISKYSKLKDYKITVWNLLDTNINDCDMVYATGRNGALLFEAAHNKGIFTIGMEIIDSPIRPMLHLITNKTGLSFELSVRTANQHGFTFSPKLYKLANYVEL